MGRSRLEFDAKLRAALGSTNVYYKPPESVKMKYPAIVYKRTNIDLIFADNVTYRATNAYEVTVIAKDPDFPLVDELPYLFPMCRFNRHYTVDNLNHDNFTIYY